MQQLMRIRILAFALLTCMAVSASAQNYLFLRDSPIGWLDAKDQQILLGAINSVLDSPDGTKIDWSNPDSGSNGRIQVLDKHEDFGTTCRSIRMRNEAKGRKSGGNYRLCLSEDGQWRFAPNAEEPAPEASPKAEPEPESKPEPDQSNN
jgi:surface antigen